MIDRTAVARFTMGVIALVTVPLLGVAPVALAADVTVLESGFEGGTTAPWAGRGSATVAVTTTDAHTGSASLLVSGRTADWNGAQTDVTGLFTVGATYAVSAWVKLAPGEAVTDLKLTVAEQPEMYTQVSVPIPVTSDAWVRISGSYTMPAGRTGALLYIEAAGPTTSFLIDDALVSTESGGGGPVDPPTALGLDADFETDLGAWTVRGDGAATAAITTTDAHSGMQSALVSGRTQPWNGLGADVSARFRAGAVYDVSAWLKLAQGEATTDLKLSIQRDNAGASTYETITTIAGVTSGSWTRVQARLTMGEAETSLLYFESAAGTASFLVDDIVVASATALPVQTDIASLKDELPWPVGVAIDIRETTGPPAELVTKHFSQITPENALKPESTQSSEGVFTFEAADALADFAVANGLRFYGHTLVWHSQTPDWFFNRTDGTPLSNSAADQQVLRDRMRTHIETVADHYRQKYGEFGTPGNPLVAVDVVNEAIAENESDGLRRSRWYEVLGEGYIDLAFEYASAAFNRGAADGPVTLFINDYSTEAPAKRQAMFDVVSRMLQRGVPVNAVGHQFHVNLAQPIAQMKASIDKFSELGLIQAVTELDIVINGVVTQESIVDQGYYYADVFDMLRRYPELFSVTVWGAYDSRSWLQGDPLVFDDQLQAKPAYYGIVNRSQLPARTLSTNAPLADIPLDAAALTSPQWNLLPLVAIAGAEGTRFSARWADGRLTAYVEVADATNDGANDSITVFGGAAPIEVPRTGSNSAVVVERTGGYAVVVQIPLDGIAENVSVPFDLRIKNGPSITSWNDRQNTQEDGGRLGRLNLTSAIGFAEIPRAAAAPVLDGQIDAVWTEAATVRTDTQVVGAPGASADVRLLWSDGVVHLLFQVVDPVLDDSSSNAYEEDSVEIFLDPVNAKAGFYQQADGQYRVNFAGVETVSGDLSVIGNNLSSATSLTEGGYIVEVALATETMPGSLIGLDLQVNDAAAGVRNSVRSWSDPTGRSYQDTSRWGVARLAGAVVESMTNVTPPVISGSATVGAVLSATSGTWNATNPTVAFQWNRDGQPIDGAIDAIYLLVAADAGRGITVTVTAAAAGYRDGTVVSAQVVIAKVSSSVSGSTSRIVYFGGRGISYNAHVRAADIEPTGKVTVYDNGRAIASTVVQAGAGGRASLELPRLSRGVHFLTSEFAGNGQLTGSVSRLRIVIIL